jgi:Molecular chaperone, HSP90 family
MLEQATAEEGEEAPEPTWETINSATALWTKPKRNVKKQQYIDFYKHVSGDFEEPLSWTHNHVEGKQQYISLLYIPTKAPFDLNEPVQRQGIKLYIQRVFVMEDTEKLMPRYLRFVRGLVDSSDLPLNVSREILQDNRLIQSIRSASIKKVLGLLENMAKKDADKFETFWKTFGPTLKEGPVEDFANREQILKLLRFASSHDDVQDEKITLDDYIGRMQPGQEKIFYITADSFSAAKNSPHLEIFRKKGIEVLLMSDRVDEWLMGQVNEYDGKQFQSVAKGELDLDDIATKKGKQDKKVKLDDGLLESIKTSLEDKVEEVKVSERLTTSPSCIVLNEHDMALYMQQLMQQAGQDIPVSKPVLEINPGHDILKKMADEKDQENLNEWSQLLLDQAILCEGGRLEDPAGAVARMNRLMMS